MSNPKLAYVIFRPHFTVIIENTISKKIMIIGREAMVIGIIVLDEGEPDTIAPTTATTGIVIANPNINRRFRVIAANLSRLVLTVTFVCSPF